VTVVPRWLPVTTLALCGAGLVTTGYLTFEHYTAATTFACPRSATINCVKVTTSRYAELVGVPVALLGLVFYLVMTALCLPVSWRTARWGPLPLGRTRVVVSGVGVCMVVYLFWAELFRIDAICLWCTAVHVITVVLFAVVVFATASGDQPSPPAPLPAPLPVPRRRRQRSRR
jgi:uncharacterized membrane protein